MSAPSRLALAVALSLLGGGAAVAQDTPAATATIAAPAAPPLDAAAAAPDASTPPDAGVSRAPPPVRPRRAPPKAARKVRRRRAPPTAAPVVPPDAGLVLDASVPAPASTEGFGAEPTPSSGWTFWDVGPPAQPEGPSAFDRIFERLDAALWPVVQVLVAVFLLLRLLSWFVRRLAKRGRETFVLIRRGWVFVEGTTWLLTGGWAVFQLSARESPSATLLALVAFAVLIALSWNGLRDVAAGLILAAERPFALGDHVSLSDGAGRVRAFRSRVLELEADDGLRIRVPYRRVLGAAKVRKGGRRTTHAVQLELEVPEAMDPQDALRWAKELAASSPWAVLSQAPRLELVQAKSSSRVRLVAFALDGEARPLLHADLVAGWREAGRRPADGRTTRS